MEERRTNSADRNGDELLDGEDIEVEMALLSLLAARDVGAPTERVDLHALSPTEKQVLLQMMRARIGFVEPARLENSASESTAVGVSAV